MKVWYISFVLAFVINATSVSQNTHACECTPPFWYNNHPNTCAFPHLDLEVTTGWISNPFFSDEFSGNFIDRNKWVVWNYNCHGMSQFAIFLDRRQNVWINNDTLHLKIIKEPVDSFACVFNDSLQYLKFSSGGINSKYRIRYGYIAIGAVFPNEPKINPAIWTEGSHYNGIGFDEKDEMDLFESIPAPPIPTNKEFRQNYGHNMFIDYTNGTSQYISFNQPYPNRSMEFAVEWLPTEIHYLINGHISLSLKYADTCFVINQSNKRVSEFTCIDMLTALPQNIILSLALPNAYDSMGIDQDFKIAYVHSYKLVDGCTACEYWPYNFLLTDSDLFKVNYAIKLGGDQYHIAVIPDNRDITLWATNYILLDKGFTIYSGSKFTARTIKTDPEIFNMSQPTNNESEDDR